MKRAFFCSITLLLLLLASTTQATNYYWVGGTGNWSDYNHHWATTSGGNNFQAQVPRSVDSVYFDANSFTAPNQTITIDQTIVHCADMDWSSVSNRPTLAGTITNVLRIFGSMVLSPNMAITFSGKIIFEADDMGKTIFTANQKLASAIDFDGAGSWTLWDSLKTSETISILHGNWYTAGQAVTGKQFVSTTPDSISLSTSVLSFSNNANMWNMSAATKLSADSSTIIALFGGTFTGGGHTYRDVTFLPLIFLPQTAVTDNFNTFRDVYFGGVGKISAVYARDVVFVSTGTVGNITARDVTFNGVGYISTTQSTFRDVVFRQNGTVNGNCTYRDLTFSPGYSYSLNTANGQQTITGILHADGTCMQQINISGPTTGQGIINQALGMLSVSHVNLLSIKAVGGATFTANSSVDLGNNTGWVFNNAAPQNLYWVGNTGNWSDGNHWALTSGGLPAGCAPTAVDNVFFDANSFTASAPIVTIDVLNATCADMDWTGATNNPALSGAAANTLNIYGSLTLARVSTLSFTGKIIFKATTLGKTITSNGRSLNNPMEFSGTGGYTLLDSLNNGTSYIYINSGDFHTAGNALYAGKFASYTSGIVNLGTSVLSFSQSGNFWSVFAPTHLSADSSTIVGLFGGQFSGGGNIYRDVFFYAAVLSTSEVSDLFNSFRDVYFASTAVFQAKVARDVTFIGLGTAGITSARNITFNKTGYLNSPTSTTGTFQNVRFLQNGNLSGNASYHVLTFSPGYSYVFANNSQQTILDTLYANGTCAQQININCTTGQATMLTPSGTITASHVNLQNVHAGGGGALIANNSVDLGNNTGWVFHNAAPQNLYWVGGTGNWSDGSHWATTSGGQGAGCAPTAVDNVFFDNHSFSATGQTVTMDMLIAMCADMSWVGVTNTPTLAMPTGAFDNVLYIYGSLAWSRDMNILYGNNITFLSDTPGKTITSNGLRIANALEFKGMGSWTLVDSLSTNNTIRLTNGDFNTANQNVRGSNLISKTKGHVKLGTSTLFLASLYTFWEMDTATQLLADSSTIIGVYSGTFVGGKKTYGNLSFISSFIAGAIQDDGNTFRDIYFVPQGRALGNARDITFMSTGYLSNCNARDVVFQGLANIGGTGRACSFRNLTLYEDGNINTNCTINTLTFSPGHTYTLSKGTTQTILSDLDISGNGNFPVRIQSSIPDSIATIVKATSVCLDYIRISDIAATGGATFYIGMNSQDLGGSTGWTFLSTSAGAVPAVAITASLPGPICPGTLVTFAATDSNAVDATYEWLVNHVTKQSDTLKTFTTNSLLNGDTVMCRIISRLLCTIKPSAISNAISLMVDSSMISTLSITTSHPSTICSGTGITFVASSVNALTPSYQWLVNGVQQQLGAADTFTTHTLHNGDSITCIMSTTGTCGAAAHNTSNAITVSVASDSVNISLDKATMCSADTANICAPLGFATYLWNNGATTNCITTGNADTYSLTVTDSNGCTAISKAVSVAMNIPNVPIITYINHTLFASEGANYQWMFNGKPLTGASTSQHTVGPAGNYQVLVMDSNGCSTMSDVFTFTAIPDISSNGAVRIFPNPFQDAVWVEFDVSIQDLPIRLEAYNVIGEKVFNSNMTSYDSAVNRFEINTASWMKGIYLLRFSTSQASYALKIVKQ